MKLSQAERLRRLLSDGAWHSTPDIQLHVYGANHLGVARIGARVKDLRDRGCNIEGKKDEENPAIFHYRMKVKAKARIEYVNIGGVMHARMIQPGGEGETADAIPS